MKILLVEDDHDLNHTLSAYLAKKSHEVIQYFDGKEAYEHIDSHTPYGLYIIDIRLPNVDGLELLALIRATDPKAPVIMITAEVDDYKMKKAYALGCDQYIKKPLGFVELDAKMLYFEKDSLLKVKLADGLYFHLQTSTLKYQEQTLALSKLELEFVILLAKNIGQVVDKHFICKELWGEEEVNCPLRQLVSRLKIRFPMLKECITNIQGVGYTIHER